MLVNGRSINFGVVDTGLDADHSEFVGRIVPFAYVPNWGDEPVCQGRRGFDPSRHGTHISSIIAGREVGIAPGGGLSVAGLAEGPGASITTTTLRRLLLGLDWLYSTFLTRNDQGQAFILNFSLGFPEEAPRGQDPDEYARAIVSLETVIHALADDNMLIIAAIGNDGEGRYRLPAGLLNVIGVGAVDRDGKRIMRFSGSVAPGRPGRAGPDLVGFGQGVLGADGRHFSGENLYARWSGTSQASAYVSGIAGLYWSMNRRMPAADVRALLMDTAMRAPRGEDPKRWGHGLARFSPPLELVRRFKAE